MSVLCRISLILLLVPLISQCSRPASQELSWFIGCWETNPETPQGALTQEIWKQTLSGSLSGKGTSKKFNETTKTYEVVFEESLSIDRKNGQFTYTATPAGAKSTTFSETHRRSNHGSRSYAITFQNARHDFPQSIAYEYSGAVGEHMFATVMNLDGTKYLTWEYTPCSTTRAH